MSVHISNRGQYQGPVNSNVDRQTTRTSTYCISVLSVGAMTALGISLGVVTGSLSISIAWILLLAASILVMVAGIVAEKDRRAGRVPAGGGSGQGSEHSLTWYFVLAVFLVIGAIWSGSTS